MAKGLFESENKAAPVIDTDKIPSGETYRARFIMAGAVGYADGTYFLPQCAVDNFACTIKGKPVLVGHSDVVDEDDMKKKAVGYVCGTERCEDGSWCADFVVFDEEAKKKINEGALPYVSCGYKAQLSDEDLTINNVKYKKRIVGGEMLHLALVKNPRYNGTEIWRNSADDCFVAEGVLYNKKEKIMNLFKKVKQEVDAELLVNTKNGEMTIDQLVNALEEANSQIEAKDAEIADLKAKLESAESQTPTQPEVEEEPSESTSAVETEQVENAVDTDAEFKESLNNSLATPVEKVIVKVPNVKIK